MTLSARFVQRPYRMLASSLGYTGTRRPLLAWRSTPEGHSTSTGPAVQPPPVERAPRDTVTVLWLEWSAPAGDRRPSPQDPGPLLCALVTPLLQQSGAHSIRSPEQAVLAGVVNATAGLLGAWYVRALLHSVGVRARIGLDCGPTSQEATPLMPSSCPVTARGIQAAAGLARLAQPTEILVTAALRDHPRVVRDEQFVFIPQQRRVLKSGQSPGPPVSCYVLALSGTTKWRPGSQGPP
jgi:hypothetical protein